MKRTKKSKKNVVAIAITRTVVSVAGTSPADRYPS